MDYSEKPLAKSKIIATVGPACEEPEMLLRLIRAGVDLFRVNMAHGTAESRGQLLASIRAAADELETPVGLLADLSGPKIRLGVLPNEGVFCQPGDHFEFVRGQAVVEPPKLTCTYQQMLDDLQVGDRVLLADGQVELRVEQVTPDAARCSVQRPGMIRSRQGINLPGVQLSTPSLTKKDLADLDWVLQNEFDYVGLSFVRSAADVEDLRTRINAAELDSPPRIVAKIEKIEAVNNLERIIDASDAVMVARGDLGVEVDITRVPMLQKRIITLCNTQRIPVITATQMLDSMQHNELPTRAEVSDVANAVIDGSDAVMLSGETAVGSFPAQAVGMMSRIAHETERLVASNRSGEWEDAPRTRALVITEGVTIAANAAAEYLNADLIIVATHTGRTAMAISRQRSRVPIVALTDVPETARRMTLFWGVKPIFSESAQLPPEELLQFVTEWGREQGVVTSGSRLVLVGRSLWSKEGHDVLMVHVVP